MPRPNQSPQPFFALTFAQSLLLLGSVIGITFLSFYLGARFGPEIFWNIDVMSLERNAFLPEEALDAEVSAMLAEAGEVNLTFHQSLKKTNSESSLPALVKPTEVPDEVLAAKSKEAEKEEQKAKEEQQKTEVTPEPKKPETTEPKPVEVKVIPPPKIAEKPVESKPVEVKPVAPKPIEPKPAEVKTTPVKPVEPKPVPVIPTEPKPQPVKPGEVKPAEPKAPEAPAAPAASSSYTLQVGSFGSLKEAMALQDKLKSTGQSVRIEPKEIPGKGTWYRVKLGRYPNSQTAEAAAKKIKANYGIQPVVTE